MYPDEMITALGDDELEAVSGGVSAGGRYARIINCMNSVKLRSSPRDMGDDNLIGFACLNEKYLFYGWSGNWAKVQYGNRIVYVYKDYVYIEKG